MLVHCRVTLPPPPSIEFANTHLYTWNVTDQGLNPDRSIWSRAQLTMRPGHSASPNPQLSFANIDIVARVRFECKKLKRNKTPTNVQARGRVIDFKPVISTVLNQNGLSYNSQKESFSFENSFQRRRLSCLVCRGRRSLLCCKLTGWVWSDKLSLLVDGVVLITYERKWENALI